MEEQSSGPSFLGEVSGHARPNRLQGFTRGRPDWFRCMKTGTHCLLFPHDGSNPSLLFTSLFQSGQRRVEDQKQTVNKSSGGQCHCRAIGGKVLGSIIERERKTERSRREGAHLFPVVLTRFTWRRLVARGTVQGMGCRCCRDPQT